MIAGDTPRSDVAHERFRSSDPAEVEQFIRTRFVDLSLDLAGGGGPFSCEFTTAADPLMGISRMRNSRTMVARTMPLEDVVVVHHCRSGRMGWSGSPYGEVLAGPGDVVLVPPSSTSGFAEEVDTDLVSLDAVALADHAAHTCGIDPEDLRFTGSSPVSPAFERYWLATVAHVRDAVLAAEPVGAAAGVVLENAFRSLATAMIATFPNTARTAVAGEALASSRRSVPDAALRRLVDVLRVHAAEPLGPADVAAASGVPYRDVVAALMGRYDVDPDGILWDARLRGVRRDLVDSGSDGDSTVAELAARWGFRHDGEFRTAYAREFGETPERTFRR